MADTEEIVGTTETAETTKTESSEKHVPYERFAEVVAAKNKAVEELAGLRASVTEIKAGHTSELSKLQEEVKTATDRATQLESDKGWSDNLVDLAKDGIHDSEITEYLRYKYDQTKPEEGTEKPAFGDWFQTYKASEPTVLKPFLGGTTTKTKPVKAVDGTTTPNVSSSDPGKIASMSREEYQANRAQLLKSVS